MGKHTPEPWGIEVHTAMGYKGEGFTIIPANQPREEAPVIVQRNRWKNGEADGRRIVACVNACAGLDVGKLPALLEAVRRVVNCPSVDIEEECSTLKRAYEDANP